MSFVPGYLPASVCVCVCSCMCAVVCVQLYECNPVDALRLGLA